MDSCNTKKVRNNFVLTAIPVFFIHISYNHIDVILDFIPYVM